MEQDTEIILNWIDSYKDYSQENLLLEASQKVYKLEVRLAAALMLCTCDSNERKAGE